MPPVVWGVAYEMKEQCVREEVFYTICRIITEIEFTYMYKWQIFALQI